MKPSPSHIFALALLGASTRSTPVAAFCSAPVFGRTRHGTQVVLDIATADDDESYVIDAKRRWTMNLLLLGSATLTVGSMAVPYLAFFMPPVSSDGSGAMIAQDQLGNDIIAVDYLNSKQINDHSLVLGLKGDPT